MRRIFTLAALVFCSCAVVFARTEQLVEYKDVIDNGYNFYVKTPFGASADKKLPVILFLHGRSLCGSDLTKVLKYGCLDAIKRGVAINAIVVAPQTRVESWDESKLNDVLNFVVGKYNVDQNKIYVIGMSMGGWGTLKMVEAYPDRIAAGLAMCGGYTGSSIDGLLKVPLWIMHGVDDDVTPHSYSLRLAKRMISTGKADRLICDWPRCDHSILARVFYLDEMYRWLFSHSLADNRRPVNRSVIINEEKIQNAYSMIKGKPVVFEIVSPDKQ